MPVHERTARMAESEASARDIETRVPQQENLAQEALAERRRGARAEAIMSAARSNPGSLASLGPAELRTAFSSLRGASDKREFLWLLSQSATSMAAEFVASLRPKWQVQYNMARHGLPLDAQASSEVTPTVPGDPSAPFTGVGATGINASDLNMSWVDAARLNAEDEGAIEEYSNPMSSSQSQMEWYENLSAAERQNQARVLLGQSVSSNFEEGYAGSLPSRADVIRAAASAYNLEPELVAAFILTEQRDQSQNEDAAEYFAARLVAESRDTSVGLAQVMTYNDHLIEGLVSRERIPEGRGHVAYMLASDEVSIFACAQYIREVADMCPEPEAIPETARRVGSLDLSLFAEHSSQWSRLHIILLGSEYTSSPWDDRLVPGWGNLVYDAYEDVRRVGIFS